MKYRDPSVDVAKGICMLLIFGIHTEAYVTIGMPLTYIAVPMFFFMSGFFDSSEKTWRGNISKWLRTLLIPIMFGLFYGTIYNLILDCVNHIPVSESQFLKFDYICPNKNNGTTWFLFALFYVKILSWSLSHIPIDWKWLFPILILFGYIGSTYQLPFLIDEGLAAMPFYWGGKLLFPVKNKIINRADLNILGVAIIVLFSFHLLSFMINPMACGLYSPNYLIALLCVFFSFVPVMLLSEKLKNNKILKNIGIHTLGLLIFQLPFCSIAARIAWRLFERDTVMWYLISAVFYILAVSLSYLLTIITEKYCPFLLGKK